MHKLTRPNAPVNFPAIARKYQNWDDFAQNDQASHSAIGDTLYNNMQQQHCAYCEGKIEIKSDGHIEHFRKRGIPAYTKLTFAWDNLFFSCSNAYSCGKYKDNKAGNIDYTSLLDPAVDNPEDFLVFTIEGKIEIKKDTAPSVERRAKETIRVFNLDGATLTQKRRAMWLSYSFLYDYPADQIDLYLDSLAGESFITMLYHIYKGKYA